MKTLFILDSSDYFWKNTVLRKQSDRWRRFRRVPAIMTAITENAPDAIIVHLGPLLKAPGNILQLQPIFDWRTNQAIVLLSNGPDYEEAARSAYGGQCAYIGNHDGLDSLVETKRETLPHLTDGDLICLIRDSESTGPKQREIGIYRVLEPFAATVVLMQGFLLGQGRLADDTGQLKKFTADKIAELTKTSGKWRWWNECFSSEPEFGLASPEGVSHILDNTTYQSNLERVLSPGNDALKTILGPILDHSRPDRKRHPLLWLAATIVANHEQVLATTDTPVSFTADDVQAAYAQYEQIVRLLTNPSPNE